MKYYYLVGKEIHSTNDVLKWGEEFEKTEKRIVARTSFGETDISTVFIGIDHGGIYEPNVAPLVFETMIFGGVANYYCDRYETWKQAVQGHINACKIVVIFWNRDNINSFVWDLFKVIFVSMVLLIFGVFLVVIL